MVADIEREAEKAKEHEKPLTVNDFYSHGPDNRCIHRATRNLWPNAAVDARLNRPDGMKPSNWLAKKRSVEQMTWAPGLGELIKGSVIDQGGWIEQSGCTCYNLYRPPTATHGDPNKAELWIAHIKHVYPDDYGHIIEWLAQRVQNPAKKINHALVLGGKQGIGKDTILEPVKYAVGPWNFQEVNPVAMLGRFNGFVKGVILRVNEARDLGDVDRFSFYEHTKPFIAAPPDVLRVDEKHMREYYVQNVCGVIITTNHKTNGLYLPSDDRRHYVAWSDLEKDQFTPDYWHRLWKWYDDGGFGHVAAYLAQVDLTDFDPKAPPPKTEAFWHIVDATRAPEESELADILDALNWPPAVTRDEIARQAEFNHHDFADWLKDRRNRRQIPHRLESAGYEPVRNDSAQDGLWKINGKRQVVYAKTSLSIRDRYAAAGRLGR